MRAIVGMGGGEAGTTAAEASDARGKGGAAAIYTSAGSTNSAGCGAGPSASGAGHAAENDSAGSIGGGAAGGSPAARPCIGAGGGDARTTAAWPNVRAGGGAAGYTAAWGANVGAGGGAAGSTAALSDVAASGGAAGSTTTERSGGTGGREAGTTAAGSSVGAGGCAASSNAAGSTSIACGGATGSYTGGGGAVGRTAAGPNVGAGGGAMTTAAGSIGGAGGSTSGASGGGDAVAIANGNSYGAGGDTAGSTAAGGGAGASGGAAGSPGGGFVGYTTAAEPSVMWGLMQTEQQAGGDQRAADEPVAAPPAARQGPAPAIGRPSPLAGGDAMVDVALAPAMHEGGPSPVVRAADDSLGCGALAGAQAASVDGGATVDTELAAESLDPFLSAASTDLTAVATGANMVLSEGPTTLSIAKYSKHKSSGHICIKSDYGNIPDWCSGYALASPLERRRFEPAQVHPFASAGFWRLFLQKDDSATLAHHAANTWGDALATKLNQFVLTWAISAKKKTRLGGGGGYLPTQRPRQLVTQVLEALCAVVALPTKRRKY